MKKLRLIYFVLFCCVLFAEVFIALFTDGGFMRFYMGDILVTVLICLFVRVLFAKGIRSLPIWVFLFSTVVEIAQYFDIVKVLALESNSFLSVLIGRTFSFLDLVCYASGCIIFFFIDRSIQRRFI